MRFVAAIDTRIYGHAYAQGAEVDTSTWTRKQMLQFLNLGLVQASQITAGMITDALVFEGAGVTTTTNEAGQLVVIIEEVAHELDWLSDVEISGVTDGQLLGWDQDSATWGPVTMVLDGAAITLGSLSDVDTAGVQDGWTLRYHALTGSWLAQEISTTLAGLEDVDTTGIVDGQTLVWDNSEALFVPGTPAGSPGPPGPVAWAVPVPWTSSLTSTTTAPATVVTYLGSTYLAIAASTNVLPTVTSSWRLVASKGDKGATGDTGPASTIPGPPGTNGTNGTNGVGVPSGGTTGQVLKKASNTSYDTAWAAAASGGGGGYLGAWSALTAYPAGSIVTYGGRSWGCAADVAAGGPAPVALDSFTIVPAPADSIALAQSIYIETTGSSASSSPVNNAAYTSEVGEPPFTANPWTHTGWVKYTPASSGSVTFDTIGGTSDNIMRLYQLSGAEPLDFTDLVLVASNDDSGGNTQALFTVALTGGVTYYVQLGTYGTGIWKLNLTNARATDPPPTPWTPLTAAVVVASSETFSVTGELDEYIGVHRLYNDSGSARTLTRARASVGTPPTGGPVVVDINIDGTTAFTAKPTIASGSRTATATPSTITWPDGSYLTVDIDAVGLIGHGFDLAVTVSYTS